MLTINGLEIPEPPNYQPAKEAVYINQMTSATGEELADFQRTRYVLSLSWEWVPPKTLLELQALTDPSVTPEIMVTFDTPEGEKTGRFRVQRPVNGTKLAPDPLYGSLMWADVTMELREV